MPNENSFKVNINFGTSAREITEVELSAAILAGCQAKKLPTPAIVYANPLPPAA